MSAVHAPPEPALHGVLAEFGTIGELIRAIDRVREEGYTAVDAYSPFPSHDIIHALHLPPSRLPWIVLAGGLIGCFGAYALQYWTLAVDYPLNIGGRPLHAWVNFIPPAFETTILLAAFSAVIGMLALNGLPQPYHPVFNAPRFNLASQDRFFLVIEASDPKFNAKATKDFLSSLQPREVVEVEH